MALERIEPEPMALVQLGIAQLTAVLAEVNRDSKKKITPFKTDDFIFTVKKKAKRMSEDAIFAFFKALAGKNGNNRNTSGKGKRQRDGL